MPALKPLPSLAKVEANRRNAARSTGPKTAEGKARARGNACKHGLAGAGIALPTEDAALVLDRFAALRDQLQPTTPLGEHHVGRIALATLRLDRAARHEAAALSFRVRHAEADFDRTRHADAESAMIRLRLGGTGGPAARRDLLTTPEGVDRLLDEVLALRDCLTLPEPLWSEDHGARLNACLGLLPDPLLPSRVLALTGPLLGQTADLLTRRDLAAIAEAKVSPATYALRQILGLIDAEITALEADRAAFDPDTLAADRAEAADRALFDPSPAAQLARRYEAAAARELARSLKLFREAEVEGEPTPTPAEDDAPTPEMEEAPGDAQRTEVTPEPTKASSAPAEPIEESATIALNSNDGNHFDAVLGPFGGDQLPWHSVRADSVC